MVRRARLIVAVGTFLVGCAVLVSVGCAGMTPEAPKEERTQTEATGQQGRSTKATASEEGRCGGTRSLDKPHGPYLTNDVPGCPDGGLLTGTDGRDKLYGGDGADRVRGHGATDEVYGGLGEDVVYGGPGNDVVWGSTMADVEAGRDKSDDVLYGGDGDDLMIDDGGNSVFHGGGGVDEIYGGDGDVVYGGDGGDMIDVGGAGQARIYCGEGIDFYVANEDDHVSSTCEEEAEVTVMY